MSEEPYVVIALHHARRGCGDDVAAALREHSKVSRKEPGCVGFVAHRSIANPDAFVMYETYRSEADWQAHQQTPHYRKYVVDTIRPLLKARDVDFYRAFGGTD